MSERNFKTALWIKPPFVIVKWQKERPGLSLGIIKYRPDMVKYGQLRNLYLLKEESQHWMCQIIERRSLLACQKAFDRCAHFDRIFRENNLELSNKKKINNQFEKMTIDYINKINKFII